jgi:thiazole synthase ThiGH ThiG subunit
MPMKKGTKVLGASPAAKMERAAIANRSTPARTAAAMKIAAQEGTTNASGGRPASKPKAKAATSMPLVDKFVGSLKKESTPYTMGGSKK